MGLKRALATGQRSTAALVVGAAIVGAAAAAVPSIVSRARHATPAAGATIISRATESEVTSAEGLTARIREAEARLAAQPDDAGAAMRLSEALLRRARATGDTRSVDRAGAVLRAVLKTDPGQYDALRMLGAIQLSQHRFREALETGTRARDERPDDPWNYGVMGDAQIELGEYESAFRSFDTMMSMRPGAAAYGRVAYARELQGDLAGALDAMQLAARATAAPDNEATAWYQAQIGELYLRLGNLDEADRAFRYAAFVYPNYPMAIVGQGKVRLARGDRDAALKIYLDELSRAPTLDLAARIGDVYATAGNAAESERYFQLAEDLAGPPIAQTEANLALFLADHDRKLTEAVTIAESVARVRRDIHTMDALAWAYFKTGQVSKAAQASAQATRTGSRDERLRWRAAEIQRASRGH
ncbi:MAG TPA: tetratricopeptide repeat protein [Vicinamibacterales bacterium]|jgi:tetratricopeptide (TPR) repeat protein